MSDTLKERKIYRILTNASSKAWDKIAFWTTAKSVDAADGNNLETKVGAIKGITTSTSTTTTGYAADATVIKKLNDSLGKQSKIINYSKLLYLKENTESYTATEDCWIFLIITSNGTTVRIYIDNMLLTMCGAASIPDVGYVTQYYPLGAIYLPKGSTIRHNGAHEFNVRAFGCQ